MKTNTVFFLLFLAMIGIQLNAGNYSNRPYSRNFLLHPKETPTCFDQSTIAMSIGYGFPNWGKLLFTAFESEAEYTATGWGPVHFRGEFGLSKNVGIGISLNYTTFGAKWTTTNNNVTYLNRFTYNSFSVLGRLNLHFAVTDQLDPYFGVGAGYRSGTYDLTSNDPAYDDYNYETIFPVGFETTLGLRYYFSEGIGMYVELGLAKSLIQGGLAVAF
jgi:opacity protein-like surface antigen